MAKTNETISPTWRDLLAHMLGAGPHIKKRDHGYRNRFCAEIGSEDHGHMLAMAEAGLVVSGRTINEGRDIYFSATMAGCEAIGLHKAAIKRAFGK